jgi:hypothetical protein
VTGLEAELCLAVPVNDSLLSHFTRSTPKRMNLSVEHAACRTRTRLSWPQQMRPQQQQEPPPQAAKLPVAPGQPQSSQQQQETLQDSSSRSSERARLHAGRAEAAQPAQQQRQQTWLVKHLSQLLLFSLVIGDSQQTVIPSWRLWLRCVRVCVFCLLVWAVVGARVAGSTAQHDTACSSAGKHAAISLSMGECSIFQLLLAVARKTCIASGQTHKCYCRSIGLAVEVQPPHNAAQHSSPQSVVATDYCSSRGFYSKLLSLFGSATTQACGSSS